MRLWVFTTVLLSFVVSILNELPRLAIYLCRRL
jgi:hypothetical protein